MLQGVAEQEEVVRHDSVINFSYDYDCMCEVTRVEASSMEEQILNYLDMLEEQRENSLRNLKSIGFYPAYGKEKTMKKVMDKSVAGKLPQFYFVFRKEHLIGYMFIIGDIHKY